MDVRGLAALFLGCLVASCLTGTPKLARAVDSSPASVLVGEQQRALVIGVLDQYMDALNQLDLEAHVATYHFPHYRHASGQIVVWQNPREAIPILGLPVEERRTAIRAALEPDWDRSEWTRRDIVQASPDKVHVATRFVRLREDGSVIKTFDSL